MAKFRCRVARIIPDMEVLGPVPTGLAVESAKSGPRNLPAPNLFQQADAGPGHRTALTRVVRTPNDCSDVIASPGPAIIAASAHVRCNQCMRIGGTNSPRQDLAGK